MSMQQHLVAALEAVRPDRSGHVSSLPQTSVDSDPDRLGVAIMTTDGRQYAAGDSAAAFAIQSMSKGVVYAMALQEHGFEVVAATVGVEPSGESYDTISVEDGTGRPDNPMINAGAMAVHALIGGRGCAVSEREERIVDVLSRLAGRQLNIDEHVVETEFAQAYRNLAIAHMLRAEGGLQEEPRGVVLGYLRQCAVSVTTEDLAAIGATFARGGRQPVTGESIFSRDVVRRTLSVMMSCGMYDSAGDWISEVGVPAKSGVSGGILGAVPGRGGIATYSPRLDAVGGSVRGQRLFGRLADELGLHFVDALHAGDERWERALRA